MYSAHMSYLVLLKISVNFTIAYIFLTTI